jgi:hypothetical protein
MQRSTNSGMVGKNKLVVVGISKLYTLFQKYDTLGYIHVNNKGFAASRDANLRTIAPICETSYSAGINDLLAKHRDIGRLAVIGRFFPKISLWIQI